MVERVVLPRSSRLVVLGLVMLELLPAIPTAFAFALPVGSTVRDIVATIAIVLLPAGGLGWMGAGRVQAGIEFLVIRISAVVAWAMISAPVVWLAGGPDQCNAICEALKIAWWPWFAVLASVLVAAPVISGINLARKFWPRDAHPSHAQPSVHQPGRE